MAIMTTSSRVERLRGRWNGLSDHQQVGASLAGVGAIFGVWLLFWPVPTEVEGRGVLIYPGNAGILNARAAVEGRWVSIDSFAKLIRAPCVYIGSVFVLGGPVAGKPKPIQHAQTPFKPNRKRFQ